MTRLPRPRAVRPAKPSGRAASLAVRDTARRGMSVTRSLLPTGGPRCCRAAGPGSRTTGRRAAQQPHGRVRWPAAAPEPARRAVISIAPPERLRDCRRRAEPAPRRPRTPVAASRVPVAHGGRRLGRGELGGERRPDRVPVAAVQVEAVQAGPGRWADQRPDHRYALAEGRPAGAAAGAGRRPAASSAAGRSVPSWITRSARAGPDRAGAGARRDAVERGPDRRRPAGGPASAAGMPVPTRSTGRTGPVRSGSRARRRPGPAPPRSAAPSRPAPVTSTRAARRRRSDLGRGAGQPGRGQGQRAGLRGEPGPDRAGQVAGEQACAPGTTRPAARSASSRVRASSAVTRAARRRPAPRARCGCRRAGRAAGRRAGWPARAARPARGRAPSCRVCRSRQSRVQAGQQGGAGQWRCGVMMTNRDRVRCAPSIVVHRWPGP